MNENQCYTYANTSKDYIWALREHLETASTSSVETSQTADTKLLLLSQPKLEFNEIFALFSYDQLDIKNALECYRILLSVAPTNIAYNFNYGALLGNIGNYADSIQYLSVAA